MRAGRSKVTSSAWWARTRSTTRTAALAARGRRSARASWAALSRAAWSAAPYPAPERFCRGVFGRGHRPCCGAVREMGRGIGRGGCGLDLVVGLRRSGRREAHDRGAVQASGCEQAAAGDVVRGVRAVLHAYQGGFVHPDDDGVGVVRVWPGACGVDGGVEAGGQPRRQRLHHLGHDERWQRRQGHRTCSATHWARASGLRAATGIPTLTSCWAMPTE
jgi:hypothetical protein